MNRLELTQEWYAKYLKKTPEEFDEYDMHVCKVLDKYNDELVNKNDLLPLVSFNAVEVLDLLTKLLEENMCSYEGDRLINQLLKSKT